MIALDVHPPHMRSCCTVRWLTMMVLFWLSSVYVRAQFSHGAVVEEVLQRADTTAVDTAQITVAAQLTELMFRRPEGVFWTERLADLSGRLMGSSDPAIRRHATLGMAKMHVYDGTRKLHRGDLRGGLNAYTEGIRLAEAIHDTMALAILHNDMGMLYEKALDPSSAEVSYKLSMRLSGAIGKPEIAAHTASLFSALREGQGRLDDALVLLRGAEAHADSMLAWYMMHRQASILLHQGDTVSARALHEQAAAKARRVGGNMLWPLAFSHMAMTSFHMALSEDPAAVRYAELCLADAERSKHRGQLCTCHGSLATIHARSGNDAEAERHWKAALAVAKEIGRIHDPNNQSASMVNLTVLLSELYARQGRYREASDMATLHRIMRDSADHIADKRNIDLYRFREEQAADSLSNVIANERTRFENERNMSRERVRRNVFMAASLGLLIFGVFVYRQRDRINAEKKRSEELLLNILPEEVAEELKAKGEAEAVHFDLVTVLFTDFKGFTAMSEVMTPKQLVHDLHECFSAFDRITGKYGIEKIKTIGDAYMAAGGLPTPNATHAQDAVNAALEIRDFIAEGKARKIADGLPYFEVRIGIHTGPVVAGIVGVKKFQYDIWGDTVNTASRMESSGDVGKVNISEATYALVKDGPDLRFTPRGRVEAKGKGAMEMFYVERA